MVGKNSYGQRGRTPPDPGNDPDDSTATPQPVSLPATLTPDRMLAAAGSTYLISTDGQLWSWGANGFGELGDGTEGSSRATPQPVDLPGGVTDLSSSDVAHIVAATQTGALYTWGYQFRGLVNGDDLNLDYNRPHLVAVLPAGVTATAVSTISTSWDFTDTGDGTIWNGAGSTDFAIGSDHNLYTWAVDFDGPDPATRVQFPAGVQIASVDANPDGRSMVALTTDGDVYAWILRADRANDVASDTTPTPVPLPGSARAAQITQGYDFAVARTSSGQLFAWGGNYSYQLGDGTQETRTQPVAVQPLPEGTRAVSVDSGDRYTYAVGADGHAYAWGTGPFIGDGQDPPRPPATVPTRVKLPRGSGVLAAAPGTFQGDDYAAFIVSNIPYAPVLDPAAPPQALFPGLQITYRFTADARPAAQFHLAPGAPDWLTIDPSTGVLTGTAPPGITEATYTVVATNSEGSGTAGPFRAISGPASSVTGTVRLSAGGAPLPGARVEACLNTLCSSTTSAADGTFTLPWYAGHSAALTIYPPTGRDLLPTRLAPQPVPETGLNLGEIDLPPRSAPARISNPAYVHPDGTPVVHWLQPIMMETDGCADGLALSSIVGTDAITGDPTWDVNALQESATVPGQYSGQLPPFFPMHGGAHLTTDVICPPTVDDVLQVLPSPSLAGGARETAPARSPPASRQAGTEAARTAAASSAALGLSPAEIRAFITFVYSHWEFVGKVKKNLNIDSIVAGIILSQGCFEDISALKGLIKLAVAPAIAALVDALTPWIIELALEIALINPIAALLFVPIARLLLAGLLGGIADKLIDAALDAAMMKFCTHPIEPNILIDPSGTVLDQNGRPVQGATVTLQRSDTVTGPFAAMSTTDVGIDPQVNPEITAADGVFHWDVRAGYYQIRASAPGCTSTTVPGAPAELLGPLPVPPPQVGLVLTLFCPSAPPPDRPSVTALDVNVGTPSGGTDVQVIGTGFTPDTQVRFGGTPAATVHYLAPTVLAVTAPPGTGQIHVTVSTAGGTSAPTDADRFAYASKPTVTAVSPTRGPASGGTEVTITGSGFTGATGVSFGDMPAASIRIDSDGTLHATTRGANIGSVPVRVSSPAGDSAENPDAAFTYDAVTAARLVVSPPAPATTPGVGRAFTAHAVTADGTELADVTESATFTISGGGASCSGSTCSATNPGTYTVTATAAYDGTQLTGTAQLTVTPVPSPPTTPTPPPIPGAADLSVTLSGPRTIGAHARLTVHVRNGGPNAAERLVTHLRLPVGLAATGGRRTLTFARATLGSGKRSTYVMRVHSTTHRPRSGEIHVLVTARTRDPHRANDHDDLRVHIRKR